jgi:hypothetical protein
MQQLEAQRMGERAEFGGRDGCVKFGVDRASVLERLPQKWRCGTAMPLIAKIDCKDPL